MPDGRTHHNFWLMFLFAPFLAGTVVAVYFLVHYQSFIGLYVGIGLPIGYLIGSYIDPDLDQVSITGAEGRLLHIPIIGVVLVAWFLPYGYFFKHRSFLSHFPFVSTGIRMLYMAILPLAVVIFFVGLPALSQLIKSTNLTEVITIIRYWCLVVVPESKATYAVIGVFLGLSFSDTIHWALDSLHVGRGRRSSRRKQAKFEENED